VAGVVIGPEECLSPEQAVSLYLAEGADPRRLRSVTGGGPADLCLLDRSWAQARSRLDAAQVRLTIAAGAVLYERG